MCGGCPGVARAPASKAGTCRCSGFANPSLGAAQREYHWQLDGPEDARAQVRYRPRLVTDDLVALRQAALVGAGAVHMPAVVVREDLNDGTLVNLLPDWAPRTGVVHAVYASRRGLLPSVRALLDFLGSEFATSGIS